MTLIGTVTFGVLGLIGAEWIGLGLQSYGLFRPDKVAESVFALPVPSGKADLLRGETVTLALSAHNKLTRESLDLAGYECRMTGEPEGVSVEPASDKTCAFVIKNVGLVNEKEPWPVAAHLTVVIGEQATTSRSPPATIRFHDIRRPTIDRTSFRRKDGQLVVTPTITTGREAATQVTGCEWRPADVFVRPIVRGTDCDAVVLEPSMEPLPPISVVVTFRSANSELFSAPATDEVPLYIPPSQAEAVPASHAPLPAAVISPAPVAAALPDLRRTAPSLATNPQPPVSQTPAASSSLVSSLQGTRDDDRYDRLAAGLRALSPAARLTPDQGLALLGPLTGTLRVSGLALFLPFLHTPLASQDAATLLQGLSSADRADTLHTLAGCLSQPSDRDVLLAGVYGADLQWAGTALAVSGPCTLASRHGG